MFVATLLSEPLFVYGLLVLAGVAVSFINSVSGGGSILSLPLLMWLGLPAAEANGTNRLGVWVGSLGAVFGFRKHGYFQPDLIVKVGVPGLVGSLFGALTGVFLPDTLFRPVLGVVIAWIVFETVRTHRRPSAERTGPAFLRTGIGPFLVYAAIGFYGGFLQAGVGLLMMYGFSRLGNLNLLETNALKVANNLMFASLSVLIFALFGKVAWAMALAFAAGNLAGGFLGSVIQVKKGEGFIRVFLAVSGTLVAAKLLWDAFF